MHKKHKTTSEWISDLYRGYITPLVRLAHKRPLTMDDISTVDVSHICPEDQRKSFEANLQDALRNGQNWPMVRALHRTFCREYYKYSLLRIVSDMGMMSQPFVVRYILELVEHRTDIGLWGYLRWSLVLCLCYLLMRTIFNNVFYYAFNSKCFDT